MNKLKDWWQESLRRRLVVSSLFTMVVVLMVESFLIFLSGRESVSSEVNASNDRLAGVVAHQINTDFENIWETVSDIPNYPPDVNDQLFLHSMAQRMLALRLRSPLTYRAFFVFDLDGQLLFRLNDPISHLLSVKEIDELINRTPVAVESQVTSAYQAVRYGESYISEPQLKGEGQTPVLYLGLPDKNSLGGYDHILVAEIGLCNVWPIIGDVHIEQTGRVFIISASGKIIAHPSSMYLGKQVPSELKPILRSDVGQVEYRDPLNGRFMLASFDSVDPRLGWKVVVEQAWEEAFAPITRILIVTILVLFLLILVMVLITYRISGSIIRPIQELLMMSRNITETGNLNQEIGTHGKNEVGRLTTTFNQMIGNIRQTETRLRFLATHDPLTDLSNRTLFHDRLNHALMRAGRENEHIVVLYLDLDGFKNINDTYSHKFGDLVLQTVAGRLLSCLRSSDTVARMGGDEYAVLLEGINTQLDLKPITETILKTISEPMNILGKEVYTTTSIGISIFPDDGKDPQTLLRKADLAMYNAKSQGKNTTRYYSQEFGLDDFEISPMGGYLYHALERQEFELYYQPQIGLGTGEIFCVEVLIRWNHPVDGLVAPVRFLPLAEKTGLIIPIGEWILKTACAQVKRWHEQGLYLGRVAINLSERQLNHLNLTETIQFALDETGLDSSLLELELTESIVFQNILETADQLMKLKQLGVRIAIDDFGAGYSTLSQLARLSCDTLKLDRYFALNILTNTKEAAIVAGVISIARPLGILVVAEGVETPEQLEAYQNQGCDHIQGWYISEPLPADEMEKFFRQRIKHA